MASKTIDLTLDERMRAAAFGHVRRLNAMRPDWTSAEIGAGFEFDGRRVPLVSPQRGIFKPAEMHHLLSIRTIFPKPGGRVWYDDQRTIHEQIFSSMEWVEYAFQGTNPDHADNRWLRDAMLDRVPIIYFVGIAPKRFLALAPAYIGGWDAASLKAKVAFGDPVSPSQSIADDAPTRRYALRVAQQRLHQSTFRQAVISAYDGRCALSGMPEVLLLDAAHIISDRDEQLGQPVVPNGLPLSKIHHAAFDAHLIGIDADYRLRVSPRLLAQRDGPVLESMKQLDGQCIRLPKRTQDLPDRDRLSLRFEQFRQQC